MYGIPFSAFQSRLKKKPYKDSTIVYEVWMLIGGILCLPIASIHGALRGVFALPNERRNKKNSS